MNHHQRSILRGGQPTTTASRLPATSNTLTGTAGFHQYQNRSIRITPCLRFLVFSIGFLMPAAVPAQTSPPATDADQATLVILAPRGPVFADLRISVAKLPYRTWVGQFLARQMDTDKSGTLTETELDLLTDNIRRLAAVSNSAEILREAGSKVDPPAVPATQFAEWLRNRLPKAFDLIAQPQPSDDAVRLASLIDVDGNGSVSDAELLQLFRTLRFRDLDNDETLSVSELLPYRDPRSANAAIAPDVANLPFFHVTDETSRGLTAERIVMRYGMDGTVSSAVMRQPDSSDGRLSAEDIKTLLAAPAYHLQVDVRLSDRSSTSNIEVHISPAAVGFIRIKDDSFGQKSLLIDGLPLQIVARGGGANNRSVTRGFLGQTFTMIDGDRNQYLDESEFPGIVMALQQSGATAGFAAVDRNGDKMVTREELFSFVDRDVMATASRIEVSVRQDGKTLFGLLDSNQDRRLAAREVKNGTTVLKKFDLNGDGSFAETELGTEYVLTLGLGRPEFRRNAGSMQMMGGMSMDRGDAILPENESREGPEWFRRMDRNQDGDVSRREFLGTAAQFDQLDTDQDGLLTPAEAEP